MFLSSSGVVLFNVKIPALKRSLRISLMGRHYRFMCPFVEHLRGIVPLLVPSSAVRGVSVYAGGESRRCRPMSVPGGGTPYCEGGCGWLGQPTVSVAAQNAGGDSV